MAPNSMTTTSADKSYVKEMLGTKNGKILGLSWDYIKEPTNSVLRKEAY